MLKRLSMAAVLGAFLVVGGCESDSKHDDMSKGKMSMDACSHCAGMQTATADGKCPVCGMAVQPSMK